jgi:hypothetical protein
MTVLTIPAFIFGIIVGILMAGWWVKRKFKKLALRAINVLNNNNGELPSIPVSPYTLESAGSDVRKDLPKKEGETPIKKEPSKVPAPSSKTHTHSLNNRPPLAASKGRPSKDKSRSGMKTHNRVRKRR